MKLLPLRSTVTIFLAAAVVAISFDKSGKYEDANDSVFEEGIWRRYLESKMFRKTIKKESVLTRTAIYENVESAPSSETTGRNDTQIHQQCSAYRSACVPSELSRLKSSQET